ncbi:MAG: efflux RND transporter permease subunit, partial [Planctomycetota bacterium]|nr:efflux RND transporter permease subunit [Planctomycetota bacterium]
MGLIRAFVHNPIKVAVGVLLVALFGAIALVEMPMQLTPEVQRPTITVTTRWSGASPAEVEREIVQEQEEQLKGIEGMRKLSSASQDSQGILTLEFVVGTNMNTALLKVNSRLQQVREYPEEADEPVITTANSSDQPIAWFILRPHVPKEEDIRAYLAQHPDKRALVEPILRAHNSGLRLQRIESAVKQDSDLKALRPPALDIMEYRRFAEDFIEARFERVDGVSDANVIGGAEDEMQVVVDPQALAARNITIEDLRTALLRRNTDVSAGDFWEGKRRYVVRTLGRLRTPKQVGEVLVKRVDGVSVYVRDVAEVRIGYKKPDAYVRNFGTTSIAVNAIRETGANVIEVMTGLQVALAELNAGVLKQRGLQLEQVYDETEYIYSAVALVQQNIVFGGLLTILVLLIFLRSGRSTLIVALAIPTSIIGTFLLLGLMGRSLNVISLAGLAFAVGMLVDNAVVVLESVYRRYQEGAARDEAAVQGTGEVWGAVFASTLTTLAVFLPILFIEEEAGQLFRDIALAISCSVGLSLLVSISLIPTLARRILPDEETRDQPSPRWVRALLFPFDAVGRAFARFIVGTNAFIARGTLRQLALIAGIVGVAVAATWAMFPKVEYLPTGNRNLVFGIILPPPGYNLDEMVDMGERIESSMRAYWDVDPRSAAAQDLKYPAIQDFFYVARGRQLFLGVRSFDPTRSGELIPLIQGIGFTIPGTFAIAKQASLFEQGLTGGRTIDIELSGPELEQLVQIGGRVMGMAGQLLPGAQLIPQPSLDLSNPEVHVVPKWTRAADLQVSAAELGYAVNSLVDGAYAGDYFLGGEKIDLTIIGATDSAGSLQELRNLPLATTSGALVPLDSIAGVTLGS